MDARTRWLRLDAEHWVHVSGMAATTLLVLWTLGVALAGLAAGLLVAALIPAVLAGLSGWLTSAWRRERPWAWWVWTVGAAVTFLTGVNGLAQGWPPGGLLAGGSGALLLLLAHPDCRGRIRSEASSSSVPR